VRITNVIWDEDNEEHIRTHGVEPFEVDEMLVSRRARFRHYSGARYYGFGATLGGRFLFVVLDDEGRGWVYPVTARDMSGRERRLYERMFRKGKKK
jgi:uncharacterized DUF497 family protein